jgi:hypothetical protein
LNRCQWSVSGTVVVVVIASEFYNCDDEAGIDANGADFAGAVFCMFGGLGMVGAWFWFADIGGGGAGVGFAFAWDGVSLGAAARGG